MPVIDHEDAAEHLCPLRNFQTCYGPQCMAWQWEGQPFERCETDNLSDTPDGQRPVGDIKTPSGYGWEPDGEPFDKGYHQSAKLNLPKARAQRWIRPVPRSKGFCSQYGRDHGCW